MGISCPKSLWLQKNRPELAVESGDTTPLENGIAVGNIAKGIFGEYVEVTLEYDKQVMAEQTRRLIDAETPVICEASFIFNGLYCAVDILRNLGDGKVEIYEVKAENSLKDINYDDISFQVHVLRSCGYDVVSANLVHLNKDYVRHGEIELDRLFVIKDVTNETFSAGNAVKQNLSVLETVLSSGSEPDQGICDCCSLTDCPYWQHCSEDLPEPNVFSLNGVGFSAKKKLASYRSGIVSYEDLAAQPDLPPRQRRQVEVHLSGEPYIDAKGIGQTLRKLSYPLYFLDFETYSVPIPPYDNISPYMQVPFQYSLHYIETEGGELKHTEFLATPGTDSRRELAEQLVKDIPVDVCTTAYNASFEKNVIKRLADMYPDLAEHLMNIHDNIEDLEIPFKNQSYVLPDMKGKSSIKLVLPALFPDDPELDYHNLEGVHKGTEANAKFLAMAGMSPEEQAVARRQLLKYCGLDTYAMVKIWEKLKETAWQNGNCDNKPLP